MRIAGADRKLFHIDIRCVQEVALFSNREHRHRIWSSLCRDRGAFERVERDVDLGPLARRIADLFTDIEHRCFVAFTLTDYDGAVHIKVVERSAHRFDGSSVRRLFITPADHAGSCHSRSFGHAYHFKDKDAVHCAASQFSCWLRRHFILPICA